MIGQSLAHYQITEHLGRGGMGEVYRARDTKLDRDVALKLLHDEVSRDPERLARFQREAKVLASLNHPNIASLHGLEEVDGCVFLVMELAEGEDLSQRIARGPIPTDEVVRIAAGIARGLEAAHESGVVHRDLKPSNIKLSPDGEVKILDFGLARAYASEESATASTERSPTITAAFTGTGVILGTAAYMSPEQARGRPVDKRADIWAFGAVLWEMISGERLFAGETVGDTLAAVLTREIAVEALPGELPATLRHIVLRSLERDPKKRLRDVGEARLLLEDPHAATMLSSGAIDARLVPAESRRPTPLLLLPWVLLVAVLAAGLVMFLGGGTQEGPRPTLRRFEIQAALPSLYNTRGVEISPDGAMIAVFAKDGLWVRDMDRIEPRLLLGPDRLNFGEVGSTPFWSPDSQWIAFSADGQLQKIPAAGGTPAVICSLPGGWGGGAWGYDDTIVFNETRGPMYRVNARGGDPEILLPIVDGEILDYHQPTHVFDGGGFVYSVHRAEAVDTIELYRAGKRTRLLHVDEGELSGNVQVVNNPVYSPTGHIVYQRDKGNRGLWALPFDAASGSVTGEPFLIRSGFGHPSVSRDGTLVHTQLATSSAGSLVIISREGEITQTLAKQVIGLGSPAFSPDDRRIAYAAGPGQDVDIHVHDRDRGITSQLTFADGPEKDPTWIPGSDRVAYSAPHEDACDAIWARDASGLGERELLALEGSAPCFGPDGLDLVFSARCRKERGLMYRRLDSDEGTVVLRDHPAGIYGARISPGGKHIAYITWESGTATLEVADFPAMTGRRLIVRNQTHLRWSASGDEIYYVTDDPAVLMAAQLEPGDGFSIRATRPLFELPPLGLDRFAMFDVSSDGSEFAFVSRVDAMGETRSFTVVENWFEEFRED